MSKDKHEAGRERIDERRREVETRLRALRAAIADETGHAPNRRGALTFLVALTVGLALALRGKTRRLEREAGAPE